MDTRHTHNTEEKEGPTSYLPSVQLTPTLAPSSTHLTRVGISSLYR